MAEGVAPVQPVAAHGSQLQSWTPEHAAKSTWLPVIASPFLAKKEQRIQVVEWVIVQLNGEIRYQVPKHSTR